jgi:prevent-host-death family protein
MRKPKAKTVNVHEAKTNFSKLLKRIERGEEVIIARAGKPVARLSRLPADPQDRTPGSAKGLIGIADDFDAPMPDLEQAFEE